MRSETTHATSLLLLHLLGDLTEKLHSQHVSKSTVSEACLFIGVDFSVVEVVNAVFEAVVHHFELHFHFNALGGSVLH